MTDKPDPSPLPEGVTLDEPEDHMRRYAPDTDGADVAMVLAEVRRCAER